ncbi:hypothetical protein B2J93_3446 [Marssonina coronariae]|uniref:Uncharacterized protein n=1 Tax=Diplocarpon coronariae TaxID=2795749 RepID=A0A218Z6N9_9HELO|nr:hypothetical protein B2J93_3446 [Marssonina coronariae]
MANDAPSPVAALPDAMVEKPARHAHRGFSGALAGKELDDDARFATAAAHAMPLRQGIESSAARAREDRCLLVPRTHVAPRDHVDHRATVASWFIVSRVGRRPIFPAGFCCMTFWLRLPETEDRRFEELDVLFLRKGAREEVLQGRSGT